MPKTTFYNLSVERRAEIMAACKREFETHDFGSASVSAIVEALKLARGSFYQYFEDLQECYFTVLAEETAEVHGLFLLGCEGNQIDLFEALDRYGEVLAEELLRPERYNLYRKRFLNWTVELETAWRAFRAKQIAEGGGNKLHQGMSEVFRPEQARNSAEDWRRLNLSKLNLQDERDAEELMQVLKALVHNLIQRLFTESWDKESFLAHYRRQILWLREGMQVDCRREK